MKDFTITKVGWHTRAPGDAESRERVLKRFRVLLQFLQENKLLQRELPSPDAELDDDFAIKASDLTDVGLEVMREAYDRWLKKVDAGMEPSDTSILLCALRERIQ